MYRDINELLYDMDKNFTNINCANMFTLLSFVKIVTCLI
jgi:hypothetical protein